MDHHEAGRQGAAEGGGVEEGGVRRGHRPVDHRVGAGRARQVGGVGDGRRAARDFGDIGRVGADAKRRDRRRRRVDDGRVGDNAGLVDVQVVQQRRRVAGHQQVDDRRLLLVRVGYAGLDDLLLRHLENGGRQVVHVHRVGREVLVGVRPRGLARQVIHQRCRAGYPPGIGVGAIQRRGVQRLRQHGAVGQLEVVGLAGVAAPQALDRAGRVAARQGQAGVDVGAPERDAHRLAGAPVHLEVGGGHRRDGASAAQADRFPGLAERDGVAVDPDGVGPVERDGNPVGADFRGQHGDDADGGTGGPGLQPRLDLERVAGDGGLRQDELALGLEVVIQAVEGRDVDVAPCGGDGQRRRRRCRDRRDGADDVDGLGGERAGVAGGIAAGRVEHDLLDERADGAGVQRDDRVGVGVAEGDAAEAAEAAVGVLAVAADGEVAVQQVRHGSGGGVQRLQAGGQSAGVLLRRAEVQRVGVAAVGG